MRYFILIVLICLSSIFVIKAEAVSFTNEITSEYNFLPSGEAEVKEQIRIFVQNLNIYPTDFTLQIDPENTSDIKAKMDDRELEFRVNQPTEEYPGSVTVFFPTPEDTPKEMGIDISYKLGKSAINKGKNWEITLPIMRNNQHIEVLKQKFLINVPSEWGPLQFATPSIDEDNSIENHYEVITNNSTTGKQMQMVFGKPQLYDLTLTYHLNNTNTDEVDLGVAFPPELKGYQQVYVNQIVPKPNLIQVDSDKNVLGVYHLKSQESIDINFKGQILIGSEYGESDLKSELPNAYTYLIADKFWEVNMPEIEQLASELKSAEQIHRYVVNNLVYDEAKLNGESIERLGALEALNRKNNAACMEYTDLSIALMRAAGIPTREVDGYVYLSDQDKVSHETRVKDVLHAWVQYWQEGKGWVNIDPTWEATTGRDYFNQFDYDHIIFVHKGVSSTFPYPAGAYRSDNLQQQDVQINISEAENPEFPSFNEWYQTNYVRRFSWWQSFINWLSGLFN